MGKYNRDSENDLTPTERRFGELLRQALDESPEYNERKALIKPVDYSFMNKEVPKCYKEKNNVFFRVPLRAAAIVLCFLVAVTGTSIGIVSQPANAVRFEVEKKFYQIKNALFSTNQNPDEDFSDENMVSFSIDTMDDLDKALKFMPGLPVPAYIPEGQELTVLQIQKSADGDYNAYYQFSGNSDETITINIHKNSKDSKASDVYLEGKLVELKDRQLCIWEDAATDAKGVCFIKGDLTINITGSVEEDEMVFMAEKLD